MVNCSQEIVFHNKKVKQPWRSVCGGVCASFLDFLSGIGSQMEVIIRGPRDHRNQLVCQYMVTRKQADRTSLCVRRSSYDDGLTCKCHVRNACACF